ncbi:EF-hand domain-containing protein [Luteimonas sp. SDU101]|uniref:EF-hand domain-containing protein n=1 Tax=unclassified Luteimonas TaxID=2629088 RepID=UPI003EB95255
MKTTRTLALTTLATAMAFGTAFAQDTTPPTSQTPVTQPPPTQTPMPPTRHDATGATHGSEHGMKAKPSYAELDSRGDGRVARADLAAHPKLQEKFADIDAGGDGTISRSEYDAWKARKKDKARDGNPSQP